MRYIILDSYTRMLTPSEVQSAISTLSSLSKDKDVAKTPVLLALAIGYQRLGDAHKAKHELRKLQVKIGLSRKVPHRTMFRDCDSTTPIAATLREHRSSSHCME